MEFFFKGLTLYRKNEEGGVAVMAGLIIPVLIGFGALAYEVGYWYQTKQTMQNVADICAFGGAVELSARGAGGLVDRVEYLASENNFVPDVDGSITVNNPPSQGDHVGDNRAVEVIITSAVARTFTKYFYTGPVSLTVRAVVTLGGGPACIYSLNKTKSGAFSVNGNTTVNLTDCGIAVNSSDPDAAMSAVGNSNINADFINVVGGASITSNVTVNTDGGGIQTDSVSYPNPLQNMTVEPYGACTYTTKQNYNSSTTINPGVYCGGVSISGPHTTVTMNPGTYYIEGGSFKHTGGNLIGNNVTIVLSGKNTGNYAQLDIAGGSNVTLNAPTTGTYAHVAIFQDPNAPTSAQLNKLTGNSTQNISGIIYFPKQTIQYSGNSTPGSPCVLIVADTVNINGNSSMQCTLGDLGDLIKGSQLKLVE